MVAQKEVLYLRTTFSVMTTILLDIRDYGVLNKICYS